jgi:hypothetical protein
MRGIVSQFRALGLTWSGWLDPTAHVHPLLPTGDAKPFFLPARATPQRAKRSLP